MKKYQRISFMCHRLIGIGSFLVLLTYSAFWGPSEELVTGMASLLVASTSAFIAAQGSMLGNYSKHIGLHAALAKLPISVVAVHIATATVIAFILKSVYGWLILAICSYGLLFESYTYAHYLILMGNKRR